MAEMNRTVEKNLLAIIDGLTTSAGCCASGKSCACNGKGSPHAC
jgi:hypothetical protein